MAGTSVAAVSKRSQYPIERSPETEVIVDAVVSFRRPDGSYELRRELDQTERRAIEARRNFVVDNVQGAKPAEIINHVLEMLIGFGGAKQSEDDARLIATQYAVVLGGLPTWAIKRACMRWAMGQVTPEEIGEKTINRSFAPSAANVRVVAEAIVRPAYQEVARINKTRAARMVTTATDEQRAEAAPRIQAGAEQVRRVMTEAQRLDRDRDALRQKEIDERALETSQRLIRREYEARGLVPIEKGGMLVSLPMLLSLGWTIDHNGIREVLVEPAPVPKRKRQPAPDLNT